MDQSKAMTIEEISRSSWCLRWELKRRSIERLSSASLYVGEGAANQLKMGTSAPSEYYIVLQKHGESF
jgi:hypothetical protein